MLQILNAKCIELIAQKPHRVLEDFLYGPQRLSFSSQMERLAN